VNSVITAGHRRHGEHEGQCAAGLAVEPEARFDQLTVAALDSGRLNWLPGVLPWGATSGRSAAGNARRATQQFTRRGILIAIVRPLRTSHIMTLRDFAEMTVNVIREDGIAEYLPTLLFPETQEIRAIRGIPDDVDHREAIQNVVRRSGHERREFFFGIRSEPGRITTGHFRPGQPTEFMEIYESPDGYSTTTLQACDWWRVT
jgi:hypothetical protein